MNAKLWLIKLTFRQLKWSSSSGLLKNYQVIILKKLHHVFGSFHQPSCGRLHQHVELGDSIILLSSQHADKDSKDFSPITVVPMETPPWKSNQWAVKGGISGRFLKESYTRLCIPLLIDPLSSGSLFTYFCGPKDYFTPSFSVI